MEEKIEALLAQAEREQQDVQRLRAESADTAGNAHGLPAEEQSEMNNSS